MSLWNQVQPSAHVTSAATELRHSWAVWNEREKPVSSGAVRETDLGETPTLSDPPCSNGSVLLSWLPKEGQVCLGNPNESVSALPSDWEKAGPRHTLPGGMHRG